MNSENPSSTSDLKGVRRLRALTTTALAPILILLAWNEPASAQSVLVDGGSTPPIIVASTGTNAPKASDNPNGDPGAAGGGLNGISVIAVPNSILADATHNQTLMTFAGTGGSGGAGGDSTACCFTTSGNGGAGGLGANGGELSFTMQSVGGNGFQANGSVLSLTSQGGAGGLGGSPAEYGLGGGGGSGGDGGGVQLTLVPDDTDKTIPSFTSSAPGYAAITLISQGGQGGAGGDGSRYHADSPTGPTGGAGGAGGSIITQFAINLTSSGSGILAASVGGSAGAGGEASSDIGKGVGGKGGTGGDGGNVQLTFNGGSIVAAGASGPGTGNTVQVDATGGTFAPATVSVISAALYAESRGGLGGFGAPSGGTSSIGGSGGAAGSGGTAEIALNGGSIATTGYGAVGALALSVGAAGGDGAEAGGFIVRKGGTGGPGGDGGLAAISAGQTLGQYVAVATSGADSDAFVTMSVGGGGGYAGGVTGGGAGITLSLGGQGGQGGDGGQVSVANGYWTTPDGGGPASFVSPYVIATTGASSRGYVAQSIGGGGGRGGDAEGINLGPLSLTIGGNGGNGGDGGVVDVNNFGIVQTAGGQSIGIIAQSVGGGGGAGGGAIAIDVGSIVTASVAVGGSGGQGGFGGAVAVDNFKQVVTSGANAIGILAQSVGGGGGVGGTSLAQTFALNPPDVPSVTLTTAVGGNGGSGGYAGAVSLLNAGLIATQGADAAGIYAQSVGGGGGIGGDASATSTAYNQSKLTVSVAIGGSGGSGGVGGAVTALNSGLIQTFGQDSAGVYAQSVGGGGGAGGFGTTNAGAYNGGGDHSAQIAVAVGGSGGSGGDGGAVTIDNYVDATNFSNAGAYGGQRIYGAGGIATLGDNSNGVFAQSVGGGGGNAGDALAAGSGGQINVNVAIGGTGGAGGVGGAVTVNNGSGSIVTSGANSAGVFAQSVGGGGGLGGQAATGSGNDPQYSYAEYLGTSFAAAVGASPSSVTKVTGVTDDIWDWKDNVVGAYSAATRLQSIAAGYEALNTGGEPPEGSSISTTDLTVDIGGGWGGKGGSGGDGGTVSITNTSGSIITSGAMSAGLFGESVGGGGGSGGASNPSLSNDKIASSAVNAAIGVGGAGGASGNGGFVHITSFGAITTTGDLSEGMIGQSIGGGGGSGGLTIAGNGSVAMYVGAQDGAHGDGGAVTLDNSGAITTSGNDAIGMLAQSVGGGGGLVAVMGSVYDPDNGKGTSLSEHYSSGLNVTLQIDGDVGEGSHGGAVTADLHTGGAIKTSGINSYGILAQSVGGSGGLMIVGTSDVNPNTLFKNRDPEGTDDAYGGIVTVSTEAQTSIVTLGNGAAGILAQSVGGGGGIINGLDGVDLTAAAAATPGNRYANYLLGGDVTVTNMSDIVTTGAYAPGIFAQSVGDGGGIIGRGEQYVGYLFGGQDTRGECGTNPCEGDVVVNLNSGTITVSGAHSVGVYINSQDNSQNHNTATVNLNSGRVFATGESYAAILLNATDLNTVNNSGVIDASGSSNQNAIQIVPGAGPVKVDNMGTIRGSVVASNLGTFENALGGTFDPGPVVQLGAAGMLTNEGTINVGGAAKTAGTIVTGTFVQNSTGVLMVDADLVTGKADLLAINGAAEIGGTVALQAANVTNRPVTVLTATGGVTLESSLKAPSRVGLYSFPVAVVGDSLQIQPKAYFAATAATFGTNQRAVAANLQALFDDGSHFDAGFTALAGVKDAASFATTLNSLSGETLGAIAAFRFDASQSFVANMYSGCASFDRRGSALNESNCVWSRVVGSDTTQDTTGKGLGYNAQAVSLQTGYQRQIASHLFLSGSVAYETSQFKGNDGSSQISGQSVLAGAYLRYHNGSWTASGALDTGYGWFDSSRSIQVADFTALATADPHEWHAGVHSQLAYQQPLGSGSSYLKPFADVHLVYVRSNGFTEQGSSPFDLAVEGQGNLAASAAAGVEFGGSLTVAKGVVLHPFASAAVEALNGDDWHSDARFAVVANTTPAFRADTPAPTTLGKFSIGADIYSTDAVDLRIQYTPEIGDHYNSQAGVAKLSVRF